MCSTPPRKTLKIRHCTARVAVFTTFDVSLHKTGAPSRFRIIPTR